MNLKDLSEELQSYIADAEKLERVMEAFRAMERNMHINYAEQYVKFTLKEYLAVTEIMNDDE